MHFVILEVTDEHIAQLNDTDLRSLVGNLCQSHLLTQGQSPAAVTWGGHQNAADGGIDVRVSLPPGTPINGFVPRPRTGLQCKAQDMPRSAIVSEMAPDGKPLDSIAELASVGGAYIIVSSKGSLSDRALRDRLSAMQSAAATLPDASSLLLDFYDRRRLATWVNQHPGLIAWVRDRIGQSFRGWRPFGDWSSSPSPVDAPYLLDEHVRLVSASREDSNGIPAADGIYVLREILMNPKGIVRLVGLSGVGKTRLIQALFDDRVAEGALTPAEALYTDISDEPDPVPLEMLSHLISSNQRAVMIVDNCGVELHRKLAARIRNSDCSLSVITVEYDINDDEPENTDVFKLEPASEEVIEKILEARFPTIAPPSRRVIAEFSAGNARIALALAETAKNGESLVNLRDSELFSRLFDQAKGANEQLFDVAKVCALLYSFDGETLDGPDSELEILAQLAGVSVEVMHKHIAELFRRHLVQKRGRWRAILPHALAHRLAKRALEDIPLQRIENALVDDVSPRVLRSFSRRIGYLHDNDKAVQLADQWLAEGGLLSPLGNLNELGEAVLENVAPIDPDATLTLVERAASSNEAFFSAQNRNRKVIARLLRHIAYEPALFERCATLLKQFAMAENPEDVDSAIEPLRSLFFIYLSGTLASPEQRAGFIKRLVHSESPEEAALGVKLLAAMLQTSHFSSHYSFEFGARKRDFGLQPRSGSEIRNWYKEAIYVAREAGISRSQAAPEVRRLFATQLPQLVRAGVVDEIVGTVAALSESGPWEDGWIAVRSAIRRSSGDTPSDIMTKLESLEQRLRPQDLASRIRAYALSPEWGSLDIADLEDGEEDESNPMAARERVAELCTDLGRELASEPYLLSSLLRELTCAEAQKTFHVGRGLASACESLPQCWNLLKAGFLAIPESSRRAQMLGGFLSAAMERSAGGAEDFLDEIARDARLHSYLVGWQIAAGIKGRAFERLMASLDLSTVPVASYAYLAGGRVHEGLDDEQFRKFINKLQQVDGSTPAVTHILGMRIFGARSDNQPVAEPVKVAGREFLSSLDLSRVRESQLDHMLGSVIKASLDSSKHDGLARRLCTNLLESIRSNELYAWDVGEILKALTDVSPRAVLDVLVDNGDEEDGASRSLLRDLREDRGSPLDNLDPDFWSIWAAERANSRYLQLAQVLRFSANNEDERSKEWSPEALRLINEAPEPTKVLDAFRRRFFPMSWSGSRADILASRMPLLDALLTHGNSEVVEWARTNGPAFADLVEEERLREARQDRARDEAFE